MKVHSGNWRGGAAGSATVSVTAVNGGIDIGIIPELPGIRTVAGVMEGSALYHENGYYETVDLIAAGCPPRQFPLCTFI